MLRGINLVQCNTFTIYLLGDYPLKGQLGFQDPASDWMYAIIDLHDRIIFYLIIILSVVIWILISALMMKDHLAYLHHGDLIELIWTLTPAGILWAIGLPSLRLLYIMDEILDAEITIKCLGNQWYCSNAINRSNYFANRNKILKTKAMKHLVILNPSWVTGFSDAEGCFSINIQITKKNNRYITSTFKIALDFKDIDILYSLKNYFKVGQITIHKYEARFEIMGYQNAIQYVIPHFDKYPLITNKQADYVLWKNIIMIQNRKQHLTPEGLIQCISLKANLNKGLNETLKTLFPNIIPVPRLIVLKPDTLDPYWVSGFTAGDGSFMVIIKKQKHPTCSSTKSHEGGVGDLPKTGYQVQATFNIGQHNRDKELLNKIKGFLNCGNIFVQKTDSRIVVSKFYDIQKYIIPHFTQYPLMNKKQQDFTIWCQIVTLIEKGEHLTVDGLNKIRSMRDNMRKGRLIRFIV